MPSLTERVVERAREFDVRALVSLLRANGFGDDEIRFMSNSDTTSPRSLVERVEFKDDGAAHHAVVVLNLGLLGSRTLLPSYFVRALQTGRPDMDWGRAEGAFANFIGFFDDRLLNTLVAAVCPERDTAVFRDWEQTRQDAGHIAGLASPLVLHALARGVFPEFGLRVEHARLEDADTVHGAQIGLSALDASSVLGSRYETAAKALAIDLVVEDETDDYGRAWAVIARERLTSTLLPILARDRVALIVRLTIIDHQTWVHVDDPGSAGEVEGELGFQRIRGRPAEHTITLYRGQTGTGETRALCDRVQASFPEYDVSVTALAKLSPRSDVAWPAGFAVNIKRVEPSDSSVELRVKLAQERLERGVLGSLAELLDGRPVIIGLELVRPDDQHPRTMILGRGFPGRTWRRQ